MPFFEVLKNHFFMILIQIFEQFVVTPLDRSRECVGGRSDAQPTAAAVCIF